MILHRDILATILASAKPGCKVRWPGCSSPGSLHWVLTTNRTNDTNEVGANMVTPNSHLLTACLLLSSTSAWAVAADEVEAAQSSSPQLPGDSL